MHAISFHQMQQILFWKGRLIDADSDVVLQFGKPVKTKVEDKKEDYRINDYPDATLEKSQNAQNVGDS